MKTEPPVNQNFLSVYFCGEESCAPGHFFGPAIRPHYLLHVILEGKGFYQKNGVKYHLEKGDAFLIPPMESTYYEADSELPWNYAWVGFDGKACAEILEGTIFESSWIFKNPAPDQSDTLFFSIKNLVSSYYSSKQEQLHTVGNLLILLSCMRKTDSYKEESASHQYLVKAIEYMDNNYSYPIHISDVAHYVGIDRTYLYKLFMEKKNISPKQYLLQQRLRIAAQMLCSTSYTITETALSCGFKDAPSFCNYFKKHIGSTPREFRKNFSKQK